MTQQPALLPDYGVNEAIDYIYDRYVTTIPNRHLEGYHYYEYMTMMEGGMNIEDWPQHLRGWLNIRMAELAEYPGTKEWKVRVCEMNGLLPDVALNF
jgi:hypothetical protein